MKSNEYLEVLAEMLLDMVDAVKKSLGFISLILQILLPCVLACYRDEPVFMTVLSATYIWFVSYLRRLNYKFSHKDEEGIPIPKERYTRVDKNGLVRLKEGAAEAALIYLSELEDFLEKRKNLLTSKTKYSKI